MAVSCRELLGRRSRRALDHQAGARSPGWPPAIRFAGDRAVSGVRLSGAAGGRSPWQRLLGIINLEEIGRIVQTPEMEALLVAADILVSDIEPLVPSDELDRAMELFVENDLLALPIVDNRTRPPGDRLDPPPPDRQRLSRLSARSRNRKPPANPRPASRRRRRTDLFIAIEQRQVAQVIQRRLPARRRPRRWPGRGDRNRRAASNRRNFRWPRAGAASGHPSSPRAGAAAWG